MTGQRSAQRGSQLALRLHRRVAVLGLAALLTGLPSLTLAAELRLREALLQTQRDRVTATITAVVDHIWNAAHPIGDDRDLHVVLRQNLIHLAASPYAG